MEKVEFVKEKKCTLCSDEIEHCITCEYDSEDETNLLCLSCK